MRETMFSLSKPELISLVLMLVAIFFWFAGYNAIETFFTLYVVNVHGLTAGAGTQMLTIFSVAFVFFAFPAGLIGSKIGRKKTILIGLTGLIVCFIPFIFVEQLILLQILLGLGGCSGHASTSTRCRWSSNWPRHAGRYVHGLLLFRLLLGSDFKPDRFRFVRDLTQNYSNLMVYACAAFFFALLFISFVRHGEAATRYRWR